MPASIFLSYASEDREAARSIGDALTQHGIDVWRDESELGGGDAWDQKIRRQIRECDYFMPIVSARTEARREGYFRREWRLAVERTLDMADDHPFLLPVVIDDTHQAHARVPEKFFTVQWLRVPEGRPTAALESLCRRILAGDPADPQPAKPRGARPDPAVSRGRPARPLYPPFPREEPGQRVHFWAQVMGWAARSAWISLQRLPRWVRILIYVWAAILVMSRGCTPGSDHRGEVSRSDARKLQAITEAYRGNANPGDIAKLGARIASEFSDDAAGGAGVHAVLAIPFGAPANDPVAGKLADTAFAETYGRLSITRRGEIGLDKGPLSSDDTSQALARARASHVSYVVYGAVRTQGSQQVLSVTVARVRDGAVLWTRTYPAAGSDAARIAQDVTSQIPAASSRSSSDDD